jgi:hypothetical protein
MARKTKVTPWDLTVIDVQGSEHEVFEVYESPEKEMTLGFVFDEKDAAILNRGQELVELVEKFIASKTLAGTFDEELELKLEKMLNEIKESHD